MLCKSDSQRASLFVFSVLFVKLLSLLLNLLTGHASKICFSFVLFYSVDVLAVLQTSVDLSKGIIHKIIQPSIKSFYSSCTVSWHFRPVLCLQLTRDPPTPSLNVFFLLVSSLPCNSTSVLSYFLLEFSVYSNYFSFCFLFYFDLSSVSQPHPCFLFAPLPSFKF